jgi:hypothetical protein
MNWTIAFFETMGPGGFSGTTVGDWMRVLFENRFAVGIPYWPRAAFITSNSILNSLIYQVENFRHGGEIAKTSVSPPLFVLGIWRSGTTHLHNLLAKDNRFAFPTTYQVLYPHTFLTTEPSGSRVMQSVMPATRPMDNVRNGANEPQEDEFALVASGLSFMLGTVVFPRSQRRYEKYLTLRDTSPTELERWKSALMQFLQKLTYKYGRPLILKSPAHTGRVDVLLDMFPTAKFVHIHRDPYVVFQSAVHTWQKVKKYWGLQTGEIDEERVLQDYVDIYDSFFAQRHRLTRENFCEVRFDDLARDPIGQVRLIYDALKLPEFEHVEPALQAYVQSLTGYQRNSFPLLPDATRQRVASQWHRSFAEWGYPK